MFERFTDRARRVVVLAQEEARVLGHNRVGTEHLLLGLLREGNGVAVKVLESLRIAPDALREQLETAIGKGEQAPEGHIPFTSRAKKALELSLRESLQLGHEYIGTEHILLGLAREGDGVAAQVLTGLGVSLDRMRGEVLAVLEHHAAGRQPGQGRAPRKPSVPDEAAGLRAEVARLRALLREHGIEPPDAGRQPPA
jgi:ATP-dependent Clp protease ATP-binding subunit ClpC